MMAHSIRNTAAFRLRNFSMAVLATLPMLAWYAIPFPVGLGYAIILFLSAFIIIVNNFRVCVVQSTFWIVFAYICFIWMYNHNFAIWTLLPPGGWVFFIFVLALLCGVMSFDLQLLKKYMRWVVLISAILFWIQLAFQLTYGTNVICFVPNLTGAFTYQNLSYSELVRIHFLSSRPCSIFLEPSYMAYYFVAYLTILWFSVDYKKKLFTKEILLIIATLIALRSGSGMVILAILIFVKVLCVFGNVTMGKRILLFLSLTPLIVGAIYIYLDSEIGQAMVTRTEEFSTEESSGFKRVIGGYLMFDQLDNQQQLFGISNPREVFGIEKSNSKVFYVNGFQTILLSLGYIGAGLYLLFYINLFRKVSLSSRMCIIVLLIMSLLESNYLNPYMMLLTIIPCAEYYYKKRS